MERINDHHVIFPDRQWNVYDETKKIKSCQWLIPPIGIDYHDNIHQAVGMVAVPNHMMANTILKHFEPVVGDYLATMDALMFAIQDTIKPYRYSSIEYNLGRVIIQGIEEQKPFVEWGLE